MVLRYLIANSMHLPVRPQSNPDKGGLQWQPPNKTALRIMLWHTIYAAAYSYGRSCLDKQRGSKKRRRGWLSPD